MRKSGKALARLRAALERLISGKPQNVSPSGKLTLNKINNELNMYKGKPDGYSIQKAMELEKQKIDVRNK